jgi:hypothetical protein
VGADGGGGAGIGGAVMPGVGPTVAQLASSIALSAVTMSSNGTRRNAAKIVAVCGVIVDSSGIAE